MIGKHGSKLYVAAALCALALAGCGDDSDDDGGGAGTAGTLAGSGGSGAGAGGAGSGGAGSGGAGSGGAGSGGAGSGGAGSGGAGSGGAGSGGAGSGGMAGSDDDAGMAGSGGNANEDPMASGTIAGFDGGNVTGTVTFTQDGTNVTIVVMLSNCPNGAHPVHIHQGTSCENETTQGMHWDTTRGEGIPDVMCTGGTGMSMHTRSNTPAMNAWSIGGNATTNLVGHAFVVHTGTDRIGCGVIMME